MRLKAQDTSKLESFIQGSAILIVANVCLKAINFFLLPLYTSNLTPEMLGVSDTISSMSSILFPVLVMGLDSAHSAFYFDKSDPKRADKVFNTIRFALFAVSSLPILGCLASSLLASLLFGSADYAPAVTVSLLGVAFNLWVLPYSIELRLQNRMALFGICNVLSSLMMILLNVLFVSILKIGAYSLILSSMLIHLAQALAFPLVVKKPFCRESLDKGLYKDMLRFALPLVPTVIAGWILHTSDRYIVLHYHGEAQVGLYGIGARFITVLNVVISSVSMAYTTFAFGNVENPDAKKQYAGVFNIVFVLMSAVCFTVALFSREIIRLMVAPEYYEAYRPLRDMMFGQILYGLTTIVGYGIYFNKRSVYSLWAALAAAATNLVLNFIFIPRYGIEAAAATTLVGYVIFFTITYRFSQKLYPCDYGVAKVILTGGTLYVVTLLCSNLAVLPKLVIWTICAAGVFAAFFDTIKTFVNLLAGMLGKHACVQQRTEKPTKVLYITFINMNETPGSGSAVRPMRMYQAFLELGYDVKLISGRTNDRAARKTAVRDAMQWLTHARPDICYIEPPSGPLFFACDRRLLRRLHRMNVPTGLFYRDAYWKFPEYEENTGKGSIIQRSKLLLIRLMQQRDYMLYKKCCSMVYFPSKLMASYFDFPNTAPLPPGCFIPQTHSRMATEAIPTAIYVGGATARYGMALLLDAMTALNKNGLRLRLKAVCSLAGWEGFLLEHPQYRELPQWLEVLHLSAGEALEQAYAECDFAIIPIRKNVYHDFAMPVKLMEYLSHLLPVVTTDCIETAAFVEANGIGIICKDNAGDFSAGLRRMAEDAALRNSLRVNCERARTENLWTIRAQTILHDLEGEH